MKLFRQILDAFGFGRNEKSNDNNDQSEKRFASLNNPSATPRRDREAPITPASSPRGRIASNARPSNDYSSAANPVFLPTSQDDSPPAKHDTPTAHHWTGPTFDFGGGDGGGGGGGDGGGGGGGE